MGRLGELIEGDTYQYQELNGEKQKNGVTSSTFWQDRVRQVRSESGSPKLIPKNCTTALPLNGVLPRAKSSYEMDALAVAKPVPVSRTVQRMGSISGHYARSEGAGLTDRPEQHNSTTQKDRISRQRPSFSHYNLQTLETNSRVNMRAKPVVNLLPDLLASSKDNTRRPHSTYDLKVNS